MASSTLSRYQPELFEAGEVQAEQEYIAEQQRLRKAIGETTGKIPGKQFSVYKAEAIRLLQYIDILRQMPTVLSIGIERLSDVLDTLRVQKQEAADTLRYYMNETTDTKQQRLAQRKFNEIEEAIKKVQSKLIEWQNIESSVVPIEQTLLPYITILYEYDNKSDKLTTVEREQLIPAFQKELRKFPPPWYRTKDLKERVQVLEGDRLIEKLVELRQQVQAIGGQVPPLPTYTFKVKKRGYRETPSEPRALGDRLLTLTQTLEEARTDVEQDVEEDVEELALKKEKTERIGQLVLQLTALEERTQQALDRVNKGTLALEELRAFKESVQSVPSQQVMEAVENVVQSRRSANDLLEEALDASTVAVAVASSSRSSAEQIAEAEEAAQEAEEKAVEAQEQVELAEQVLASVVQTDSALAEEVSQLREERIESLRTIGEELDVVAEQRERIIATNPSRASAVTRSLLSRQSRASVSRASSGTAQAAAAALPRVAQISPAVIAAQAALKARLAAETAEKERLRAKRAADAVRRATATATASSAASSSTGARASAVQSPPIASVVSPSAVRPSSSLGFASPVVRATRASRF